MTKIFEIALIIITCYCPVKLFSQQQDSLSKNFITINMNEDAFTGIGVGYMHKKDILMKPSFIYTKLEFPVLLWLKATQLNPIQLKVGIRQETISRSRFNLILDLNGYAIYHEQNLGTFVPLGLNLGVIPAYKFKKGFVGVHLQYNQIVCTYIKHSDYVKQTFNGIYDSNGNLINNSPKDGFYALTGNTLGYGLAAQFNFKKQNSLYFDLGYRSFLSPLTSGFNAMMFGQLPIYLNLQYNMAIK